MTAIPPKIRRILYWTGVGIGIVLGLVTAFYGATDYTQPVWLIGIISALAFLSSAVNAMAGSNVDVPAPVEPVQPGLGG